jgi:fido (protein-threonine AMPylation protein)
MKEILDRWKEWDDPALAQIDHAAKSSDLDMASAAREAARKIRIRRHIGPTALEGIDGIERVLAGRNEEDWLRVVKDAAVLWRSQAAREEDLVALGRRAAEVPWTKSVEDLFELISEDAVPPFRVLLRGAIVIFGRGYRGDDKPKRAVRNKEDCMFKWLRLKKAHRLFLASCRTLSGDEAYWKHAQGRRSLLEVISPIPLLGLHGEGAPLHQALCWLEANATQKSLSVDLIRHYHRIVYEDHPKTAGEYRTHPINMPDNPLQPAPPQQVPALMKLLDVHLARRQGELDDASPVDEDGVFASAVALYHKIGTIHPFEDANGRVARLAMNHVLRRYQMGYVVYPPLGSSRQFWEILKRSRKEDLRELIEFSRTCVHRI